MNILPITTTATPNAADVDATQPNAQAKTSHDTSTDNSIPAFAATLAAMLGITDPNVLAVPQAHPRPDGGDSELEQTAGEVAGRPQGNAQADASAWAGRSRGRASGAMNARPTPSDATMLNVPSATVQSAPLADSNTLSITVDDQYSASRNSALRVTNPLGTYIDTQTKNGAAEGVANDVGTELTLAPTVAAPAAVASPVSASPVSISDAMPTAALSAKPLVGAESNAAFAAAANVRAVADVAASNNVNTVNNNTDALNPEFRTRLNRVINRMRDEHGHTVEVVEGYRPQERQDHLYAQGRTNAGNVVTWTRSSKHTLGMAADLKIDGTYDNSDAYKQLAQIAAQEGLRTLGARDPGHVELPSRAGAAAWGTPADTTSARIDDNVSRIVGLALARSSDPSGEASDALSASSPSIDTFNSLLSRATQSSASPLDASRSPMNQSSFGSFAGHSNGSSKGQTPGRQPTSAVQQSTAQNPAQPAEASVADVADVAAVARVAQVAQVAHIAPPNTSTLHTSGTMPNGTTPNGTLGAAAAERVGQALDVRDATSARPLSHMTIALDNANGGVDRIRVDMRGSEVHTAISMEDQVGADKMSLRVGQLQQALEQQGLEAGSIRVATSGAGTGAGWTQHQPGDNSAQMQDRQPATHRGNDRQDADDPQDNAQRQRSWRGQNGGK